MRDNLFELRRCARMVGLTAKRVYDFDGKLVDDRYELRRGDYTRFVGSFQECLSAIDTWDESVAYETEN